MEGFARMYQLDYRACNDADSLEQALDWLWKTTSCAVLEVQTPRLDNDRILKDYFKALQGADAALQND